VLAGSRNLQRLHQGCPDVAVEDWVDVLHDFGIDFEELALVFRGHQDLPGAVVFGQAQGFGQGSDGLDVALDAQVSHGQEPGHGGRATQDRVAGH